MSKTTGQDKGPRRPWETDDDIGYKKPPRKHQFPKGQSGNPKGRPKRAKQTSAGHLTELLTSTITIKANGRVRKVPAKKALMQKILSMALQGHASALKLLLQWIEKVEPPPIPEHETISHEDLMRKLNGNRDWSAPAKSKP